MKETLHILFVCLGNICRSPTAQGVFQGKVDALGLSDQMTLDSAGTAAWHTGKSPDSRSILAAGQRGYDLSTLRARQIHTRDFHCFDYILAMDRDNLNALNTIRPGNAKAKPELFLPYCETISYDEVPDPYYGGEEGFNRVLDLIEDASDALLAALRTRGQIS